MGTTDPTRFPSGLGFTKDTSRENTIDSLSNRGDYKWEMYTFTPKIVASVTAQLTGIFLPADGYPLLGGVRIFTAESTGLTKTLSVGIQGLGGTALIDAFPIDSVGMGNGPGVSASFTGGGELTYTLGSADFVELDCEVQIIIVCSRADA